MAAGTPANRKPEDVQWRRVQSQGGPPPEADEEEEPPLYRTDQFRINVMKVLRCEKKFCHDWTRCPFAHPGEKATRRDPREGVYTGIACPDMKKEQRCPRGHYCPYAHNVFEYWLHPTRYRTSLCRESRTCDRKVCFFAHWVDELRTNIERPYVSPEQLAFATEQAARDPRVQEEYRKAGAEQQRDSRQNPMGRLFSSLDGPASAEAEGDETVDAFYLAAPMLNQEKMETIQALDALMRQEAGPLSNPYAAGGAASTSQQNRGSTFRSLTHPGAGAPDSSVVTGFDGLPSLNQRSVRRTASDPLNRHAERGSYSGMQDADSFRLQSTHTIDELGPTMFPDHLNTMAQVPSQLQSLGSQRNLLNAAKHLMKDQTEQSIWSTPRGPLEPQLYSTSSSLSDRQPSLQTHTAPRRFEAVYAEKLRKRQAEADRRYQEAAAQLYGYGRQQQQPSADIFQYQPWRQGEMNSLPNSSDQLHNNPQLEFASRIQQQQMQQLYQQQHMQQMQQAYQELLHSQLQQAVQIERRNQILSRGQQLAQAQQQQQQQASSEVETGFDLRFGGLGEQQGLFSQPLREATPAQPHLLHTTNLTTSAMLYTAPQPATQADLAKETQQQQQQARTQTVDISLGRHGSVASLGREQGLSGDPTTEPASSDFLEARLRLMNLEGGPVSGAAVPTTTINA